MKGLVIDEPWIGLILRGEKTWEMRSTHTQHRGRFALIRKGTGCVVGVATLLGSRGPLSLQELHECAALHRVPMKAFESGQAMRWTTAWELADVRALPDSVPYVHKPGAVIWVRLSETEAANVTKQLGARDSTEPGFP